MAVPFAAFAALTLHHFYVRGSFLLDAGWTAYLVSHGGLLLPYPKALGGDSYYNWHVGPILTVFGLLRRVAAAVRHPVFRGVRSACAMPCRRSPCFGSCARATACAAASLRHRRAGRRRLCLQRRCIGDRPLPAFRDTARRPRSCCSPPRWSCGARRWPQSGSSVALLTREDAGLHIFGLLIGAGRRQSPVRRALARAANRARLRGRRSGLQHRRADGAAAAVDDAVDDGDHLSRRPPLAHLSVDSCWCGCNSC